MVSHLVYILVSMVPLAPKGDNPTALPSAAESCTIFVKTRSRHGWKFWIEQTMIGWRLSSEEIRIRRNFWFLRRVRVGTAMRHKLNEFLSVVQNTPIPDGDESWNSKLWTNNVLEECTRRDLMKKIRNVEDILEDVNRAQEDNICIHT